MSGFFQKFTGKKNPDASEKNKARDESNIEAQNTSSSQTAPVAVLGSAKFIIKPLITEKGTFLAEHRTYIFQVALPANKRAIKEAVEKLYGVKVVGVRTACFKGKVVRYGRIIGQRSDFKKAFIQVAKGQSITIHKHV